MNTLEESSGWLAYTERGTKDTLGLLPNPA
jgi:hypothetical protein